MKKVEDFFIWAQPTVFCFEGVQNRRFCRRVCYEVETRIAHLLIRDVEIYEYDILVIKKAVVMHCFHYSSF